MLLGTRYHELADAVNLPCRYQPPPTEMEIAMLEEGEGKEDGNDGNASALLGSVKIG